MYYYFSAIWETQFQCPHSPRLGVASAEEQGSGLGPQKVAVSLALKWGQATVQSGWRVLICNPNSSRELLDPPRRVALLWRPSPSTQKEHEFWGSTDIVSNFDSVSQQPCDFGQAAWFSEPPFPHLQMAVGSPSPTEAATPLALHWLRNSNSFSPHPFLDLFQLCDLEPAEAEFMRERLISFHFLPQDQKLQVRVNLTNPRIHLTFLIKISNPQGKASVLWCGGCGFCVFLFT